MAYLGSSEINAIEDNQVAGAGTINPMVRFINGIRTTTPDFIEINPNPLGSINIDFNNNPEEGVAGIDVDFFKCEIEGSSVKCSSGLVFYPTSTISINEKGLSTCHSDYGVYVSLTRNDTSNPPTGSLQYGQPSEWSRTIWPPDGQDHSMSQWRVVLPICKTVYVNSAWQVKYFHYGAFHILHEPFFWLENFQYGLNQSLDHKASNGQLYWRNYGLC